MIQSKDYLTLNFPAPATRSFSTLVGADKPDMMRICGVQAANGSNLPPFRIATKDVTQFQLVTGQSLFSNPKGPFLPAETLH